MARVGTAELDKQRNFRFESLSAGVYDLELAGIGIIRPDIVLDGFDQVEINCSLLAAISGEVADAPPGQHSVVLISETYGFSRHAELSQDNVYRFTSLPAGVYRIELGDAILAGLKSDGTSVLTAPILRVGLVKPEGESTLSGIVRDSEDRPLVDAIVVLQYQHQQVVSQIADENGRFRFEGLGAGDYSIVVSGETLADELDPGRRK